MLSQILFCFDCIEPNILSNISGKTIKNKEEYPNARRSIKIYSEVIN